MKSAVRVAAACAIALAAATGCSTDSDGSGTETRSEATASAATATSSTAPAATTTEGSSSNSDRLVIDVSIAGGDVTPTNERMEATVGEPIVLRVNSDTTEEVHVHSVPDHSFEVEAAPGQTFEFTVDVPGQVAIELHDSGRTVATVSVRP
jgi:hypothetical protein